MLRLLSHHLLVLTLISALLGADVSALAASSGEQASSATCCGCDEEGGAQAPITDRCPDSHDDGHCPPRCGYCTVLLAADLPRQVTSGPLIVPTPPLSLAFYERSESPPDGASRLLFRPPRHIS